MPRYQDSTTVTQMFSCVLDITTSCTWTVPAGVTKATFEIWGAGGGGGAHCCCDCYRSGTGGGAGGYASVTVSVTPATSYIACAGYGGMVTAVGSCTLHWCCQGGTGGTSYVTGNNLSNFCATGGSPGVTYCYYHCGCTTPSGTNWGTNSQTANTICGGPGTVGHADSGCMLVTGVGGAAPFTSGTQWFVADACCRCQTGTFGVFPGGGGSPAMSNWYCCCSQGGVGANGLVRIHF